MSLIMCCAGPRALTASATRMAVFWNFSASAEEIQEMQPIGFYANVLQEVLHYGEPPSGEHVASYIVAVARMSAADPDTIHPLAECLQDELGAHAAGAGDADGLIPGAGIAAG
jgi:hypothetical protein